MSLPNIDTRIPMERAMEGLEEKIANLEKKLAHIEAILQIMRTFDYRQALVEARVYFGEIPPGNSSILKE